MINLKYPIDYQQVLDDLLEKQKKLTQAIKGIQMLLKTNNNQPMTAAQELGRRGGRKGGLARAAKLSPQRRTEIARKAAQTRWNK